MSTAVVVEAVADVFDTGHHASTMGRRLRRAVELGPKYYLWNIPRYLWHRRQLGLPIWDGAVWSNPIHEFRNRVYPPLEQPPDTEAALAELRGAGVRLTIPATRLRGLLGVWWSCRAAAGDVIECGSYRGATGMLLAVLGRRLGLAQTCHLLDTFRGMPATGCYDSGRTAGEFAPPSDQVDTIHRQADLLDVADRVRVHAGLFAESFEVLARSPQCRYAFAHVDANIYTSTLQACKFVIPRLSPGGAVVFDDYNGVCDLGARLAIDEYLHGRTERPAALSVTSAFLRAPG